MRSIAAVRKFGLFFGEIIEPLIRTAETAEQTGVLNQRNQFIRIAVGRNIRNIAAGFPVRPVIGPDFRYNDRKNLSRMQKKCIRRLQSVILPPLQQQIFGNIS